jgi:predicted alpha/beta hydrolase family esterase
MKNAIILHGTANTPKGNWFKWLSVELEDRGYEVWLPQLPDADVPNADKYNKLLLNNGFNFNEETLLIGHSSGAVSILNLLQELPGRTQIKAAFLVGAFSGPLDKINRRELFPKSFDFKEIKTRCSKFVFIHSDNDPYCPLDGAKYLAKELNGELIVKKGQGHFNLENGPQYNQFPFLIKLIDKETAGA